MKRIALLVVLFLLFVPVALADSGSVYQINFTDTVWVNSTSPDSEIVSGSFDWSVNAGTLSDISVSASGDIFNAESFSANPTEFVFYLTGVAGWFSVTEQVVGNSVWGSPVSEYGNNRRADEPDYTFTATGTSQPIPTPEPEILFMLPVGLMLVATYRLLRKWLAPAAVNRCRLLSIMR
jgi:hypothetical protein